jgi:hypothetical protein
MSITILVSSTLAPGHSTAIITPNHPAYGFLREFASVGERITVASPTGRITTEWEVLKKETSDD